MVNPRTAKAAIALSGRTQREVALAAGMDETKLSRIVNGRHPGDPESREAIAGALGVPVLELWPSHAADGTPASGAADGEQHGQVAA